MDYLEIRGKYLISVRGHSWPDHSKEVFHEGQVHEYEEPIVVISTSSRQDMRLGAPHRLRQTFKTSTRSEAIAACRDYIAGAERGEE